MGNSDSQKTYEPIEHSELHYIQNDEECPLPVSGPRVTVGFWCATEDEMETGPDCEGAPLFTIVYPVGNGDKCYGWKHMTDDIEDPVHPNSVQNAKWCNGQFDFTQFTTLDCSDSQQNTGTEKEAFWSKFQDFPPELYGRIIGVEEVPVDMLRQDCVIRLRACDGHFISLDRESIDASVWCSQTKVNNDCDFTVKFPNYIWDKDGGTGDTGAFALLASNGKYLKRVTNIESTLSLKAADTAITNDSLFSISFEKDSVVSLQGSNNKGTLYHPCPGASLFLADKPLAPCDKFTISYKP